jgi:hypothetical protein
VPRWTAALACLAVLAVTTSCSSSDPGDSAPTTTGLTPLTTASPERVRVVGATHIAILRRVLANERAACGRAGIAPEPATVAPCRKALAELSTAAHDFARAMVFLRPAPEFEAIVADSIDAARPVIDTVRVYPEPVCLGPTAPSPAQRASECAPAGREVAEVIALLEQQLDRWKSELGVGK